MVGSSTVTTLPLLTALRYCIFIEVFLERDFIVEERLRVLLKSALLFILSPVPKL